MEILCKFVFGVAIWQWTDETIVLCSVVGVAARVTLMERITVEYILNLVVKNYLAKGQTSVKDVERLIRLHLLPYFKGRVAERVLSSEIDDYVAFRKGQRAAVNSIHYELAILRRGYNLARRDHLITKMPFIETPKSAKAKPRKGYFKHPEYLAFIEAARKHNLSNSQFDGHLIADIVMFLYYSGWRLREGLALHRDWIRDDMVVELPSDKHKNRNEKLFPLEGEVLEMINKRLAYASPEGFLFHRNGRPVKGFRDAHKTICKEAGIGKKMFHDLRRSARTNLGLAGIPDQVGMQIMGHLDKRTYDGYNQVEVERLREAMRTVRARLELEVRNGNSQVAVSTRQTYDQRSCEGLEAVERKGFFTRIWQRITRREGN